MHTRHWQHKLLLLKSNRPKEQGFILALVVIVGLILAAGAMAMMARSSSGLLGSIRQQQSREAREIAEAGTNRVVERLNREFAYLLINCYDRDSITADWVNCTNKTSVGSWEAPKYPTAQCPGANLEASEMITDGLIKNSTGNRAGKWQLEFYHFKGSKNYGGLGIMRVRGQILDTNGAVLAEAYVDQELSIKPKNCDAAFNQPPSSTGFPGIIANSVALGNNDVFGAVSGNIICLDCEDLSEYEKNKLKNSFVGGDPFASAMSMPDVPQMPEELRSKPGITDDEGLNDDETNEPDGIITINATTTTNPNCIQKDGITHCRLGKIALSGSKVIRFKTDSGPFRLYAQCTNPSSSSCTGPDISISGSAGIQQCKGNDCSDASLDSSALALFGNTKRDGDACSQRLTLSGGSTAARLFVYAPDACAGINGGKTANCEQDDPTTHANCDVIGALWLKNFNGSNSTGAQMFVPDDMGSQIFTRLGTSFALSIRDFVAIGINNWGSFQMPPPASSMFR